MFSGSPLFDITHDEGIGLAPVTQHQESFVEDLAVPEAMTDLLVTRDFLSRYNDSVPTLSHYRAETQCFLNYLWLVGRRSLSQVDGDTVKAYLKFIKQPPASWVASANYHAFSGEPENRFPNPSWRPFVNRSGKPYSASQSRVSAARTALTAYFNYLVARDHLRKDPMLDTTRKDTRAKRSGRTKSRKPTARRFSDNQWTLIKKTLEELADSESKYEIHLFVVITMKSLFLRVSELAPRVTDENETLIPAFGDFRKEIDGDQLFWVYVLEGKGDKGREVTVPDAYLPYLERWRSHLGLMAALPLPNERDPILPSRKGGAISKRQVQRIYEAAMTAIANTLDQSGDHSTDAAFFRSVKTETHYLRHTGASQAIEQGADIRHISEELGHSDPSLTERIYVGSDSTRKRVAGRARGI